MMKARIERERQEKAGRLLQYTLNKIVDSKYVQAWDRWQEVHKAMERAGRIMHRVMCRFTNAQLVAGWERWMRSAYERSWTVARDHVETLSAVTW